MNLFAYGTLMWTEVLESVIGRPLAGVPATLAGYRRIRMRGVHYPAVVSSRNDEVAGVLYDGLSEADFRNLDRFEGEEYERLTVRVAASEAEVYVLSDAWMHLAEDRPWHPEDLKAEHLAAFRAEYKGWRDL